MKVSASTPVTWFTAPEMPEADVEPGLYHHAGLADLELVGQQLAVHQRPRAGQLPAEQRGQLPVLGQALVFEPGAHAHDGLAAGYVQLGLEGVRDEAQEPGAYLLLREGDLLLDELYVLPAACGLVLEGAGADGAHLRTEHGYGDDGHYLAARRGLDEFDIARLRVIYYLRGVGGAAGLQPRGKARGEVLPFVVPPTNTAEGLYFSHRTVKRLA